MQRCLRLVNDSAPALRSGATTIVSFDHTVALLGPNVPDTIV
jgi:hypothetical protein